MPTYHIKVGTSNYVIYINGGGLWLGIKRLHWWMAATVETITANLATPDLIVERSPGPHNHPQFAYIKFTGQFHQTGANLYNIYGPHILHTAEKVGVLSKPQLTARNHILHYIAVEYDETTFDRDALLNVASMMADYTRHDVGPIPDTQPSSEVYTRFFSEFSRGYQGVDAKLFYLN